MCGIAGFVGFGNEDIIYKMISSIQYRGPDFLGISFTENVGLAQARLSIIDLDSRSHQPFFSADKKYALVFNGEIYNYLEIKEKLLKTKNYFFRTQSDTEVLLNAYIEYGHDCLDIINGMFAFAIYNFNEKTLFLARDRMGKKPLYFYHDNQSFVFASEPKSLFFYPSVKKELNLNTLNQYLTFDYVPTPFSIYKNIYKLEPASYLIVKKNKITEKKIYWNVNFNEKNISIPDAINTLDLLLNNAVKKRMMSDVPLGVFLSGGIDSSAIAYYAQKNCSQKINTFSIGFEEKSYDESNYAKKFAGHLGTNHNEQILSSKQSLTLLPEIIDKLDEPFADPSIIPTYYLSKFTREHVTVALGGDGSDELLAGYPTFISEKYAKFFRLFPAIIIKIFTEISQFLPVSDKNISLDFKINQFLKGFESNKNYTHSLWLGSFTPLMKNHLFKKDIGLQIENGNGLDVVDYFLKNIPNENYFNQILYIYYKTYLLDDILYKVDRASMFNSLEVRVPFLDTEVVNFISTLPKTYKIRNGTCKYLLKKVMRNKLPDQIINRPKKGFGIPLSKWIREDLKSDVFNILSSKDDFFSDLYVKKILYDHISKKQNNRKLIWNLYIFKLWYL